MVVVAEEGGRVHVGSDGHEDGRRRGRRQRRRPFGRCIDADDGGGAGGGGRRRLLARAQDLIAVLDAAARKKRSMPSVDLADRVPTLRRVLQSRRWLQTSATNGQCSNLSVAS